MRRLLGVALFAIAGTPAFAAQEIELEHDNAKRSYLVHLPKGHDPTVAVPVVLALHGTNMRGADMFVHTDLQRKADAAGFILVAPNSQRRAFNDGFAGGDAEGTSTNDVGFIEAATEDVKRRYKVLANAMFLTGFSNGGSMVQRMAIESRYPYAGYASVAAGLRVKTEGISNRAPVLLVFGAADPLNPVAGGEVSIPVTSVRPSHESTANNWSGRLGCQGFSVASSPAKGVQAKTWAQCESGARLVWYEIEGLGHHWAGAEPMPFPSFVIGEQVSSPNLSDLVWDFFAAATRRP
jgi:polyhydroxybutyrate depolymerase